MASSTTYSLVAVPEQGEPLTLLTTTNAALAARRYNAERRKCARAAQRKRNPSFTIIQLNRSASAETLSRSGYTMHANRTPAQQRAHERRLSVNDVRDCPANQPATLTKVRAKYGMPVNQIKPDWSRYGYPEGGPLPWRER